MAIKRIDPTARFTVISMFDDALDSETPEEMEELKKSNGQSRYDRYQENLDESILKFRDGMSPERFRVRCTLNREQAELNNKYLTVDTVSKSITYKNRTQMFFDLFDMCCDGIVNTDGTITKLSSEDIPQHAATQIGAVIFVLVGLSKNEKK